MDVAGKVAIITGGGTGVGRATALDPANPAVRADLEAARNRPAGKAVPR